MGRLILKGIPPFAFEGNMKLPGAYFFYALMMQFFGSSVTGVHVGLILCNFSSAVFIYLIGRSFFKDDKILPIFTAICYLVMSAHYSVLGFALHATQILIPFVLFAFYALLRFQASNKWKWLFFSGIAFSCAVIIKQPALLFGIIYFTLFTDKAYFNAKNVLIIIAGTLLPFALLLVWIWKNNLQDSITTWVFSYALEYGKDHTWHQILSNGYKHTLHIISIFWLLWIFALIGSFYMMSKWKLNISYILFAVGSIASIMPGFFFRPHYYVMLLPIVSLCAGTGIYFLKNRFYHQLASLFMVAILPFLALSTYYNYTTSHVNILRKEYEIAPFAEAKKIGEFVAMHSKPDDRVLVFGSEPQIYFHANRRAACGFLYFWPFVENQSLNVQMQELAIQQIDSLQPSVIVFTQRVSWDVVDHSPKQLFYWIEEYKKNYNKIGLIDIFPTKATVYSWEEDQHSLNPEGKYYLEVYARKD